MPELPEVETIVRELHKKLAGESIVNFTSFFANCIENSCPLSIRKEICGKKINRVFRKGKFVCFDLSNKKILTIHLRMTGKLIFNITKKDIPYLRLQFAFSRGKSLFFIDPRKFGRVKIWENQKTFLKQLGPDALNEHVISQVLNSLNTVRPIKTVLLDQKILAGIGNIYADEALFRAKIYPLTPISAMKKHQVKKLSSTIPVLLKEAIRRHGTSISTYRTPSNSKGSQQVFLRVYDREKKPCLKCRTLIQRMRLQGRSSYYCPNCQHEK